MHGRRGDVTSFSARDAITPLYLYIAKLLAAILMVKISFTEPLKIGHFKVLNLEESLEDNLLNLFYGP